MLRLFERRGFGWDEREVPTEQADAITEGREPLVLKRLREIALQSKASRRFRPKTAELMLGCPDEGVWAYASCGVGGGLRLGSTLDRALKRAVQCGFCLFIFLLADLALLVLDFQLKQFFLQGF